MRHKLIFTLIIVPLSFLGGYLIGINGKINDDQNFSQRSVWIKVRPIKMVNEKLMESNFEFSFQENITLKDLFLDRRIPFATDSAGYLYLPRELANLENILLYENMMRKELSDL